jgi:hypothetical protein
MIVPTPALNSLPTTIKPKGINRKVRQGRKGKSKDRIAEGAEKTKGWGMLPRESWVTTRAHRAQW